MDPLRKALEQAKDPDVRQRVLLDLSAAYLEQGDYAEAENFGNQMLKQARDRHNAEEEAQALEQLGTTAYYQGNATNASDRWEQALAIRVQRGDTAGLNNVRVNLANAHLDLGRADEAQHLLLQALAWAEQHHARELMMRCMANLANVYALQGKLKEALAYHRRVLDDFAKETSPFTRAVVMGNLGQTQLDLLMPDSAKVTFTELMGYSRREGLDMFTAVALTGLGNAAMLKGERITAREHFLRARAAYSGVEARDQHAVVQERLASLSREAVDGKDEEYLKSFFHGSTALALAEGHALLDSAIAVFQELEDPDNLRSAYSAISEVERAQGDFRSALEHHKLFKSISDTLLNAERDRKLTERAMQYEFDKKQAAEEAEQRIRDEASAYLLQRERTRRNLLIGAGVFALIFGAISYRQGRRTQKALRRSDELLLNILPAEVADELKATGGAQARYFEQATILFTDFKGFTQRSEQVTATELVQELNDCFKAFDAIMDKYRIEKIKTIGDAYMAAGGVPDPAHGSPADVVHAALEMQQFMLRLRAERSANGEPCFEMRVGIHTGPVVAGIVGVKKFQYDIWGDTVNTASRMESSGETGRVNVSGSTYELLKNDPRMRFEPRGMVAAKGKGELHMYFVSRSDAEG